MNKIISLGVGWQSSALYYMSSIGELPRCDMAIFADTGGEKTKTLSYWEYLLNWSKNNNGISLYNANYVNLYNDLLNHRNSSKNGNFNPIPAYTKGIDGKVGMLRRHCTNEYKIAQVTKKYREVLGIGNKRFPKTEVWQGITLDEKERMRIPQEKWKINVYPFCDYKIFSDGKFERLGLNLMTRNDILNWYNIKNLPIPEKSSCKFCPFQSDENWLRLKNTSPEDFKDAILIDKAIRDSTKKGVKNPVYLHESLKPLDEITFDESQMHIWGNCMDACDI